MKKVYCIFFDFLGYEEQLQRIYETEKDAKEYLYREAEDYGYDDIKLFMEEGELTLVEWECGLQNRRKLDM